VGEVSDNQLTAIMNQLRQFVRERDWEQFHDPKNLAMAVVSEAGELVAEYRWVANTEADKWSRHAANQRKVAAEAADVGIALLLFFDRIGVDFVGAMRAKVGVNRLNYPVKTSKGKAARSRHSRRAPS
jgi:dCTP diphosphatase